jgi:hypothetical protein
MFPNYPSERPMAVTSAPQFATMSHPFDFAKRKQAKTGKQKGRREAGLSVSCLTPF